MENRKDFSCGGVVVDDKEGRFLIVQVENLAGARVWTFPKGHPESGEDDAQAALREVQEETGWKCRIVGAISDESYFFVRENVRFHKTVRWFRMEPVEKTGQPMEGEIIDCRWVARGDARKFLTYPTDLKLLEKL